ncbi:MAG TPA: PDZ domain-containing protein [Gemmatimonadaceae bacterium]|nr:PDZ domain-containing protein [Gemmatimonadaceae bacterium]
MRRTLLLTVLLLTVLLVAAAGALPAQRTSLAQVLRSGTLLDDRDRAMLGVSTQSDGKRDTLGLLIVSVTPDSPAEKAGLEEGNRIASINGVNLKLSRADAGESDMEGVMGNRLRREMNKLKPGDEATLEVWANGRYRTVKVKTAAAEALLPRRVQERDDERAALGISLSSTGSKRDTIGVFVSAVTEDGPAEKAGLVEGDRIATVNGVDLRIPKEDLGDGWMASNRIQRLQREIRKLKPGQIAELVVVSGGRSRTVRVTAVKASELKHSGGGFSYRVGEGSTIITMPRVLKVPPVPMAPKVRVLRHYDANDAFDLEGLRRSLHGMGSAIRMELNRELPKAMDEVRRSMQELRREMPVIRAKVARAVVI